MSIFISNSGKLCTHSNNKGSSMQSKKTKMASCEDVFAESMLDDDTFLEEYATEVQALRLQGVLPSDLEKKLPYKVYSFEGSSFGAHRSIVLSSDDQQFFTIELGCITVDDIKRVYPVTQTLDASLKQKFKYHGKVTKSTMELLARGVQTLKQFGSYFKFGNNCQDFCNYYLESIGLGETKRMTDVESTKLIAALGTLLVSLMLKR